MTEWPSTLPQPSQGLEEEFYKPQAKTEKEANYTQSRPTVTRGRRKFPLSWSFMTETEYQILETFFDTYRGTMFTFIHPIKNTSHNCIFSADSIKSKWKSAGFRGDVCSTSLSAILTVASGSICSLHLSLPDKEETTQQTRPTGPVLHGGVAVIAVNGFLHNNSGDVIFDQLLGGSSFETLREQFQSALNSPNVSSIIFDVDSPGGEVSGCFDLVDEIYNARGIKPIYAVANEIAFAGAYAIASAAEKIFLPRTGGIGSVGVICVHVNQSKYDENIGVKFTPIYAGSHKADFDRHAPLSAAAQKARQDEINRIYELFVSTVARSCDRRVIIRNAATGWSVS